MNIKRLPLCVGRSLIYAEFRVIPFVVYGDVLVYETGFFLFKAKNADLIALGCGRPTRPG